MWGLDRKIYKSFNSLKLMVKILKTIWRNLITWYTEDPNEREEEEDFNEFIRKVEKRMDKIDAVQTARTHEARAQVALMFENAYTQKKIVEANNSLKAATWILAIATMAFTVGTVYGVAELNNVARIALQIVVGIIVIGLALFVLKGIWNIIKFISKKLKSKK